VKDQYRQSNSQTDVLTDVLDGKTVKDNMLLNESPLSLSIILYQDSFEVDNPLGSGKKKQKILAVYLTLGEILPHNRSCTDQMQLVATALQGGRLSFLWTTENFLPSYS